MSSARALEITDKATEAWFNVPSASATIANCAVKPVAGGVTKCDDNERGIGVAHTTETGSATARVFVTLYGPVKKVKVANGGATVAVSAKSLLDAGGDGFTDASAGQNAHGIFLETGVVGDLVAMVLMPHSVPA